MRSVVVSNPGTLYDGQLVVQPDTSTPRSNQKTSVPVLKLPPSLTSSKNNFSDTDSKQGAAEYTIAEFSSGPSRTSPASRGTPVRSPLSGSQGKLPMTSKGIPRVRSTVIVRLLVLSDQRLIFMFIRVQNQPIPI